MLAMDSNNVSAATAALIGAGGAIIGGGLTSGTQLLIESQRARRERRAARARDGTALRLATRLLIEELADNEALLRSAAKTWRYWSPERQLSTAVWSQYRGTLAQVIESPLSWRVITAAFMLLTG